MTERRVDCTMQAQATDPRTIILPLPPALSPSQRKDQDEFFDFLQSRLSPHSSFTSHSKATPKHFRPQSSTPTVPAKSSSPSTANQTPSRNMAASIAGENGLCTNSKSSSVPSTLTSLTAFSNAIVVHQKRLKVNDSQLTKCSNDIEPLRDQYQQMQNTPPVTTIAERKIVLTKLKDLSQRYDHFLKNRREIIGKQDDMLEQALDVEHLMYTDELEQALDMQVVATQNLVELVNNQPLEAELIRPMREHIPKPYVQSLPEASRQATEGATDLAKAMAFFNNRLRPSQSRLDHAKVSIEVTMNRYKSAINFGVPVSDALAEVESEFEEALTQYHEMWLLQHKIVNEYKAAIEAASDSMDISDEYAEAFKLQHDSIAALGSGEVAAFKAQMKFMKG